MNHIAAAILCCLVALPAPSDPEEPERTSWTLTSSEGRYSIRVQLHRIPSHASRYFELWFDTKYADIPLDSTSQLSIIVFKKNDILHGIATEPQTLHMKRRVLIWKAVKNSLLPDTIDYRAELQIDGTRFPLPNSMAAHFLQKFDPLLQYKLYYPQNSVDDTLRFDEGDFSLPLRHERVIPIPLSDDSARVMPIPLWDGQRDVIPIPNATPEFREQPRDFIRPKWPPQNDKPDSTRRQRIYRGWPR